MGIECPKCKAENTSDSEFCKKCATPLPSSGEVSVTKTLETPVEGLKRGTTFAERYEIIEELGTGGMGKVYRVKDEKLDEEMALKVLKPEIAADKDIIERFKNELKFSRKIAHRNVCRMYDLNEEEETPYITMEYVRGEDLKSFIRKKEKLKEEEVIALAKQVCEGLAEAHELGVVHRDLKPQNIMIDIKGNAKVMDFGIARSVEAPGVTQSGVMIGTPDYMSPEQAEGEEADQRSDIYALGVILYEMVTGSVPFKGDTAFSVALKHKSKLPSDPKKLNPEVSENLSRLILICMEKERERRYQTAKALLADLHNIEDGLPLGTKIRPRRETFVTTLIHKKLFIPAVVVTLVIIVVVTWQLLPQKEIGLTALSDKPSLAVIYFENNTGDEGLDHWRKALSELITADLSQSKYLTVLSGDRLYDILQKENLLEAKSYSSENLKKVAQQGGVKNILRGSYAKAGDTFRVNTMLQNTQTGKMLGIERVEGKGEEDMFAMVDELTRRIKASFKLTSEQIASDFDKEVGKITTNSPEAYRYYVEARKYHNIAIYREAIKLYEKAVSIDPEFAMAFRGMAKAYLRLAYPAKAREYSQRALELSDRVSERERYYIFGDYYTYTQESYDKAIEAYEKLLKLYPDDLLGNNSLGEIYRSLAEWEKAAEYYSVCVKIHKDNSQNYQRLGNCYEAMGHYDKAKAVYEDYIENIADDSRVRTLLGWNYLYQKKYHLALKEAEKAFLRDPAYRYTSYLKGDIYNLQGNFSEAEKEYNLMFEKGDKSTHINPRRRLAALNITQGQFDKAKENISQIIELADELDAKQWKVKLQFTKGYLHFRMGNFERALIELERLGRWDALAWKGVTYLKLGMLNEAQRMAVELKDLIQRGDVKGRGGAGVGVMKYSFFLEGMIELEKENFSNAIGYFQRAISLLPFQWYKWDLGERHAYFLDALAFGYYKAGDLDKAQSEYERITSLTTGRLGYGDIYAKSFYMLGKIYEQQGNTAKAIDHYEKFLELWKDADPGIPELEDVRKRLAGLKSEHANHKYHESPGAPRHL